MNLRRVVLVFAALPVLSVLERYAYYGARSISAIHATQVLGMPPADVRSVYTIQTIITVACLIVGGGVAALTGPAALLVAGFVLCTIGHVLGAFADQLSLFWVAIAIGAVGQGLFRPALYALAAIELSHPREHLRSALFVALYAAVNLAGLAAPASASALALQTGTRAPFIVAAAVMGMATLLAIVVAGLWWVFRPKPLPADAPAVEPEPKPAIGGVLAAAAGLLVVAAVFHLLLTVAGDLQMERARGIAPETVALILNINPIAVLVTAFFAMVVALGLFFLRWRVTSLFFAGAGLCIAATSALPLLLMPPGSGALIASTVITAIAEVLFVPFVLSRASGDVPPRFTPLVLGVWFATTLGLTALGVRVMDWVPQAAAMVTALLAALCFVLGAVLLIAARPLARYCYEPKSS